MRQGQNSKRSRGRGGSGNSGGGRRNVSSRSQTHDSNGPNVRIRGSAPQVYEKYLVLARDASTAGDRIAAENYLQHADHYFRLFNTDSGGDAQNRGREHGAQRGGNGQAPAQDAAKVDSSNAPQPQIDPDPASQPQPELKLNGRDASDADSAAPTSAGDGAKPAPRRRGRPAGRTRSPRNSNGAEGSDGSTDEAPDGVVAPSSPED